MKSIQTILKSLKRQTSSGRFIPFVDGLRFLAIMPVIIQHASERLMKYNPQVEIQAGIEQQAEFLVSRGAIGVIIFFTLSGFILSLPFAQATATFNYKKYLGRRLTRLEPPFIFWMTCFAIVLLIQSGMDVSMITERWLASVLYIHTINYQEFSLINPVAWSLEVEIQYYLIAPFLAMLYFNQPDKRFRRAFLIVFLLLFLVYQHSLGWHLFPVKASLLGHLQHFLIGMLIADLYRNDTQWVAQKHIIWDLMAPLCLLTMAYTWTEEFGKTLLMNLALAGLFIAALKGRYFPALLSTRMVTVIGGMCYTIYLIHLPLLELLYSFIGDFGQSTSWSVQLSLSLLIALPLVLLSSMIGFKLIEQPFMKRDAMTQLKGFFSFSNTKKQVSVSK